MALSGFLSRLTKCAESQDLRLEPLDVRKATLSTVARQSSAGIALELAHGGGRQPTRAAPTMIARREPSS
jgi:hypothetical protein